MAEPLEDSRPTGHSSLAVLSSTDLAGKHATSRFPHSVMVIDGDPRMLRYIRTILEDDDREIISCESAEHAMDCLRDGMRPQIVLASSSLGNVQSSELVSRVRKVHPHAEVVLIAHLSEYGGLLPAIQSGARDILLKPFRPEDILQLLGQLTPVQAPLGKSAGTEIPIGPNAFFVFASPVMRELQEQASLVARVNLPVLILGESGTGKEVLARYIHSLSPRVNSTFLKVNCAAVPSDLLESELFGYEPGAFTGAARSKPGKFRLCNNGTMFLDEIGEMHPGLQAKLLQVLQDGTFSPLGSRTTEQVNVRILAATNIDMKAAIAQKMFREDLYYRLNGFCLRMPPLRERREEIPVLIDYFLRRSTNELGLSEAEAILSTRLMNACLRYDWPGNLRELESFVKRYLVLGDEQLMLDELADNSSEPEPKATVISPEAISDALAACGGHRRKAAKLLGISYKVLLNRLRKLGMDAPRTPVMVS